jgi:HTH-type transcriptional regulator/antitoxin HigA
MNIKPLKTEADYQAALKTVADLFEAPEGSPEGDDLEVLTTLIEAYEEQHYPIPLPNHPLAAIQYYLDRDGLAPQELEPWLGNGQEVNEVLKGKRPLTLEMIRQLHQHLGIPAEILIQPYSLAVT